MNIITENKINRTQWDEFVHRHPKGNVFQTPAMYDVYDQTPGYTPYVLALEQNNQLFGILLWVIIREKGIKSHFSARSIIQGAPLVKDDKSEYIEALLEAYEYHREKSVIYTQIRNHYEMLTINDAFQKYRYHFDSHLNFIISLDTEEFVWSRIGKGRIKQIKKAEKNGLFVEAYKPGEVSKDLIHKGYNIIQSVYKHAGLPLVDIEQIYAINRQNLLVVFVVRDSENNFIGCRFGLLFNDSIYGWYAGSFSQYYHLYPNDILIWETLKWGVQNGYKTFDYGGAGDPNKPYGVRAFKQQMGGKLVNHGRYVKIHRAIMYLIGKLGMKLLSVLR